MRCVHQQNAVSWCERDHYPILLQLVMFGSLGAIALAAFGIPPIDTHMPLHHLGVMDPLCGMTRAVRSIALGRLSTAWSYNPGSFVLAGGSVLVVARGAVGLATKRWLTLSLSDRRFVYLALALFVAALWINQQAHADLLMT